MKKTLAVGFALLLGVAAWFLFSSSAPSPSSAPPERDVERAQTDATPQPPAVRRTRAADAAPVVETPSTTDDPSKWPIRVTTNVPGATVTMQVRLYGGDPDPAPETKTTDATGFVGFAAPAKDVPVHEFEFVARADGFAKASSSIDAPGDVKIELKPGVAVRGFVRDSTGAAVADAEVLAASLYVEIETPTSRTNARGAFEVFVEKAGRVELAASHRDLLPRHFGDAEIEAPASDVVVVLERGLQISGRVSFPNGLPVSDVSVKVGDVDAANRATTDADGRYVVSGLGPGAVTLVCDVADGLRHVEAGATNVDFVVKRSLARIRYVDEKGRPFRYAATSIRVTKDGVDLHTSASSGEGECDDQVISGDRGSTVRVTASSPDGRTGRGTTTFDETPRLHDVDVVVGAKRPTGTIRLVVRWESPETPKSVYVTVVDDVGSGVAGDARKRFELDAAGAGEIPNVPAGHVKVTVAAAAHWSPEALDTLLVTTTSAADVQVGRTTEVVATLVTGGRVRATVRDDEGKAVAPDIIRVMTASDRRALDMFVHRSPDGGWTSELDASPSVMIDAVPAGRYVVRASTSDERVGEKEVDVVKGRTVDVEVPVKAAR